MKKRFLSLLLIVFTSLMLLSCSNQLKTKSSVNLDFPLNDIRNSLSARGIWDGKDSEFISSVELEVKLFVNEKLFNSAKTLKIKKSSDLNNKSFTFYNIPYDSTIYAEARIYVSGAYEEKKFSYTIMYGQSEKIVFSAETDTLPLQLKWYDDEGRFVPPEPVPLILIDKIEYQFYTQKDGTTDTDNVENYELANTISLDISPSNASSYYEYLKSYDVLMRIMDIQFDMEVGGFEENSALAAEEPVVDDKTVIIKSYWVKTGVGITPQIFNSVSTSENDSYKLYFYDSIYIIKNNAGQKLAYGTFYTVSVNGGGYKFIFCQERAYKNGIPVMLYSLHETPNNFETCNYNADTGSITLNCIDSSHNSTPITFTIPATIDLSAYAYSSLSGNIVYAGIPKVEISYNTPTAPLDLTSGSVSFTATLQNQEENPDLDMTAELYFQGRKVTPSSYKAEYNGDSKKLTVSPIALSNGGTYIVKVIAMSTSSGTAYTVSNNFIIEIDGYIRKTLDVSDTYFINDLMEFIPTVNGPAEITLTGTKNLPGSEYALEDSLYYQMSTILSTATQPITIDMTNVSGTAVQKFETTGYMGNTNVSIKIPDSINIIYYRENYTVNVSESTRSNYTNPSNDKWWFVEVYKTTPDQTKNAIVEELLKGTRILNEQTVNELRNCSGMFLEFNWNEVSELVSTGNLKDDINISTPNYDYFLIKQ